MQVVPFRVTTQVYKFFWKDCRAVQTNKLKSANITQHCKKLHVGNMTKEVKKKAGWAERISMKCRKLNCSKFAFGWKGKPEGLWFGFVYCIGLLGLLSLPQDFSVSFCF